MALLVHYCWFDFLKRCLLQPRKTLEYINVWRETMMIAGDILPLWPLNTQAGPCYFGLFQAHEPMCFTIFLLKNHISFLTFPVKMPLFLLP